MNKQQFQYSLLRYRHSYLLAEEVNIGILFLFPAERRVEFAYPNRLQRVSQLYSDFNVHTLRKYLNAFHKQAQRLTKQFSGEPDLFETLDFQGIIEDFFLIEDATALLFSDITKGTYEDAEETLSFYKDQYLSVYEKNKERDRKDEEYILNKIEEGLEDTNINYSQEVKRGYIVETPYLSQKFNFAWKNGTTNLITPIGLDLKREDVIENKALRWHGRLDKFKEKAEQDNLKFDLIISRPQDRKLFKTYENVLKILEDNRAPKEIHELDHINRYIHRLVDCLSSQA